MDRLSSPLPPSRVVYVFGSHVKEPPTDVTPTFLTTGVLSTLRQADFVAHSILRESGKWFPASGGELKGWIEIIIGFSVEQGTEYRNTMCRTLGMCTGYSNV
jgi:hypothetical protein